MRKNKTEIDKYDYISTDEGLYWSPDKRASRLALANFMLSAGIAGTIFSSFMLKHDAAWLSVLAIGIGATVKGALMIDNYL